MTDMSVPQKRCSKCNLMKSHADFHRQKKTSDGLQSQCKSCRSRSKPKVCIPSGMKVCSCCNRLLSASAENFGIRRSAKDGLAYICRQCSRERSARQYKANPKAQAERSKKYRERHRELICERHRVAYSKLTPEKRKHRRDLAKAIRRGNPDRERARFKNWVLKNPVAARMRYITHKSKSLGIKSQFVASDAEYALNYWGNCCAICGRPPGLWHTLAFDHWIPQSKGGLTVPQNLLPLCHDRKHGTDSCNNNKSNRDPMDWLIEKLGKKAARTKMHQIEQFFTTTREVTDDNA